MQSATWGGFRHAQAVGAAATGDRSRSKRGFMGREEHTAPVQKLAPSVFIRVHSLLAHVHLSVELRPGRFIHAGATGQPVDANEMVRVIAGRFDHHVGRREKFSTAARKKNASLSQRDEFVPARSELAL